MFVESMTGVEYKGCAEHTGTYMESHFRNGVNLCVMWIVGALVSAYYYGRWMWTRVNDQSPSPNGCFSRWAAPPVSFAMGGILHCMGLFNLCTHIPIHNVDTASDTLGAFVLAIVLLDIDVDADMKGWIQLVLFPLYLLGRVLFVVGWYRLHVADAFYKLVVAIIFGLWELFWVIVRFWFNPEPVEPPAPANTRTRDLVAAHVKDAVNAVVSGCELLVASIPTEIRSAWATAVAIVDSVHPDSDLHLTYGLPPPPPANVAPVRPRATRGRSASRTRGRSASRKYRSAASTDVDLPCTDAADEAPLRPRVTRCGVGLPMGGQM